MNIFQSNILWPSPWFFSVYALSRFISLIRGQLQVYCSLEANNSDCIIPGITMKIWRFVFFDQDKGRAIWL